MVGGSVNNLSTKSDHAQTSQFYGGEWSCNKDRDGKTVGHNSPEFAYRVAGSTSFDARHEPPLARDWRLRPTQFCEAPVQLFS
jgi:hypothetical protein